MRMAICLNKIPSTQCSRYVGGHDPTLSLEDLGHVVPDLTDGSNGSESDESGSAASNSGDSDPH